MKSAARIAAFMTAMLISAAAFAAGPGGYPNKPVKVIVPFAPAGPTDVMARLIAQKLSERLGQQFYVENLAGAGGNTRHGRGREIARRRLHAGVGELELRRQSEPLRQESLRRLQGLRAGDTGRGLARTFWSCIRPCRPRS